MKYFLALLFSLFIFSAQAQKNSKTPAKPKLVVGLVIDQMRWDYLFRYAKNYSQNGINRLLNGGFSCNNTNLNYIPSVTGCGHAGIYTGSVPALHGIASNDWYDKTTGKMMYCVQDAAATTVGEDGKSGKMSPKNLLATTIGDELRLATNNRSKVVGVALKDRGSILPAGHNATAAYWMDDSLGKFITSSYYMQELPTWVQNFNDKEIAKKYLAANWDLFSAKEKYYQSAATDDNEYEGKFKHEKVTSFPHLTSLLPKVADIKRTPYGNNITIDFCKEAILNYQLGKGIETDMLAVSLSSTDYVGHQFGINSLELEDTYIRLDAIIADFLAFLDKEVGANNYVLFLTADHGAAHNPKYLKDNKIPAGYSFNGLDKKRINEKYFAQYKSNVISDIGDNQIWINDSVVNKEDAIANLQKEFLALPEVQFVFEGKKINTTTLPEPLKTMSTNGFNTQRSGDLFYILKPAFIDAYGTSTTGTTHGTWNPYDSHIPLVWYGTNIPKGNSFKPYYMCDIAPTLAALLKIQVPNTCVGTPILEILK